jgi:prevent-host-death family protein
MLGRTRMRYPERPEIAATLEIEIMRRFSMDDLGKNLGDVTTAAAREPVIITERGEDRFVLMAIEAFMRLGRQGDPQRAYGVGESPPELARSFLAEVDRHLNDRS